MGLGVCFRTLLNQLQHGLPLGMNHIDKLQAGQPQLIGVAAAIDLSDHGLALEIKGESHGLASGGVTPF